MPDPAAIANRLRCWSLHHPRGPLTLELYPTLRCNLTCSFCDTTLRRTSPENELPPQRILALVDEAAALGVRRVFVLGGGEPLLAPHTPALLERIKRRGLEGVLNTNGTLLDPDLQERLLQCGWDEIHFSIDAPRAPTHDALRGRTGTHRRAVTAACRLTRERRRRGLERPRIALHTVVTRENHRELSDLVRLAWAIDAFRIDFDTLVVYHPRQRHHQLTPEERRDLPGIAADARDLARELGIATTLENLMDPRNLVREGVDPAGGPAPLDADPAAPSPLPPDAPLLRRLAGAPCLKPWHYLVVDAHGACSPCCVLAGTGPSARRHSLAEIWTADPYFLEMREAMLRGTPPARCRECSANILAHERHIRARLQEEAPS